MKKLTFVIMAAALIAPATVPATAASATGSRINTPGTEARHEANLGKADTKTQSRVSETSKQETQEVRKLRPRAALAGKVNVAARSRN